MIRRRVFGPAVLAVLVVAVGLLVALAGAGPAAALSPTTASNPLSGGVTPLAPTPTTTTAVPTAVATNSTGSGSGSGGLSGGGAIAIAVGALGLLAGIAFFIWRDARKRAPARNPAGYSLDREGRTHAGSKRPPKSRKPSAAERRRRKRGRAKR